MDNVKLKSMPLVCIPNEAIVPVQGVGKIEIINDLSLEGCSRGLQFLL